MAYADEVLADTPLVFWQLDEASGNFADSSGNGQTATAVGTAYSYQQPPGITTGYSITNASDSYGWHDDTDLAFSNANVFTLEAWIKTSGTPGANGYGIIELGTGSASYRVGPTGAIQLIKSHVALDATSTVTVNDDDWHHVVFRRNGPGTTKVFIDGVDRTGSSSDPTYVNSTAYWGFGAQWSGIPGAVEADTYFIGSLDEIAVYDSALSDARILAHYQAGIPIEGAAPWIRSL